MLKYSVEVYGGLSERVGMIVTRERWFAAKSCQDTSLDEVGTIDGRRYETKRVAVV